jgi:hypothetical protein
MSNKSAVNGTLSAPPSNWSSLPAVPQALPDGFLIQRGRRTSLEEGKRCQAEAHRWIEDFEARLKDEMKKLPEADVLRAAVADLVRDRASAGIAREEIGMVERDLLVGDAAKLAQRKHAAKLTLDLLDRRMQARGQALVGQKAVFVSAATRLHRESRLARGPAFEKEQQDPNCSDARLIAVAEILNWVGHNETYDGEKATALADEIMLPTVASELNVIPASKPEGVSDANWDAFLKMQAAMKSQAVGAFK